MKEISSLTLKDTTIWETDCPPFCDGHLPGSPFPYFSHLGMTSSISRYGLSRRWVERLVPGQSYSHELSGPMGTFYIEMNDEETLMEFTIRAEYMMDGYEKLAKEFWALQKEGMSA